MLSEAVQDEMSSEGGGSPIFRRRKAKEAEQGGSPILERERHPEEAESPAFKRKIKELEATLEQEMNMRIVDQA